MGFFFASVVAQTNYLTHESAPNLKYCWLSCTHFGARSKVVVIFALLNQFDVLLCPFQAQNIFRQHRFTIHGELIFWIENSFWSGRISGYFIDAIKVHVISDVEKLSKIQLREKREKFIVRLPIFMTLNSLNTATDGVACIVYMDYICQGDIILNIFCTTLAALQLL